MDTDIRKYWKKELTALEIGLGIANYLTKRFTDSMILMHHNIIISLGLSKRDPACSCEECETVGSVVVCFTSHKSISNHAAFRVCAYETINKF